MHTCLRNVKAFLNNERGTLEWIKTRAGRSSKLADIERMASDALMRSDDDVGLNVSLHWPIDNNSRGALSLYIGGVVEIKKKEITRASYVMCLSEPTTGTMKKVLRKYHFDFASPSLKRNTPQPVFHLQYAGTMPGFLKDSLDDSHLDCWMESPRVFYSPMSLALLLHMAFWEFPTQTTDPIRKDGYWGKLVRRDQGTLLAPYYKKCLDIIERDKLILDSSYAS